jgi:hypothetical protein
LIINDLCEKINHQYFRQLFGEIINLLKMKNNFTNQILKTTTLVQLALCLLLFLMGSFQSIKAQSFVTWTTTGSPTTIPPEYATGLYSGGVVTVTQVGGGSALNLATTSLGNLFNLNGAVYGQVFASVGVGPYFGVSKSLLFTFSTPVIVNELNIADIDISLGSWNDSVTITGVTFTSVTGANCVYNLSSAVATSFVGENSEYAHWYTSTTPVTSFTINFSNTNSVVTAVLNYSLKVTDASCVAGAAAPTLSAATIANVCPASTVDLTTLTASNAPIGTTLTWHTATPATTANKIASPSAVAAGTYYAAFFDSTNNCYSGTNGNGSATTVVTATVNSCLAVATPPIINTTTGTTISGINPLPISGTAPFVYSIGSSDPGCIAPSGFTSLTASGGTINGLSGISGEHTITAPAAVGSYYYCIKVCDSLNNCAVSIHKVVVTASCPAGTLAPILN